MNNTRLLSLEEPWYKPYQEDLPSLAVKYLKAQEKASTTYTYHNYVPGILQTEEYARRTLQEATKHSIISENLLEERLRFRMDLQWAALEGRVKYVKKVLILDETALYREVGDKEVMREQFLHLLRLQDHPNVVIHILPIARPFNIKEMTLSTRINFHMLIRGKFIPPNPENTMVYIDSINGSKVLEGEACWPYIEMINYIQDHMLTPGESMEDIRKRAEELL